jgi:septum site-determining protein MinD
MADPDLIEDVVVKLKEKVEFIFIDCPPGLCRIALIALESAEELMLIVTPEMSAVTDALKTKVIAEKLNTKLMGVVINRWTKSGFKIDKREIEKMLGEVIAVVPEDSEVMKSVSLGQPFVLKSPKSPASKAIKELASKIAGVEIKPEEKKKKGRFRLFRR